MSATLPPYVDPAERGGYDTDELDALEGCALEVATCKRYVVQTVTGFPIRFPLRSGAAQGGKPSLSAHVCDRVYGYRVVKTFRTADGVGKGGGVGNRIGSVEAVRRARALARRLNRDTA